MTRSTRFTYFCTAQIYKFQLKIANIFSRLNIEYLIFVNFSHQLFDFFYEFFLRVCPDFATGSGGELRVSLFLSNLRKQIRKLRIFIFIHYYSFASFLASASWGGWVAQAAAFLLPRTVHSSSNFLSSCFLHTFSTFRIFRFLRVIASISLVSWRREPFASKRAVNKQKSQAEILENCQALPFCFRVS